MYQRMGLKAALGSYMDGENMKHAKLVSIIVTMTILSSIVGAAWALTNHQADLDTPPAQKVQKLELQEIIRNDAVEYIEINHPETEPLMSNFTWTGGVVETFAPPATYIYNSNGWTVMIQEPLKDSQTYSITAEFVAPGIGIPYHLTFAGTWLDGTVTESSFSFAQ